MSGITIPRGNPGEAITELKRAGSTPGLEHFAAAGIIAADYCDVSIPKGSGK